MPLPACHSGWAGGAWEVPPGEDGQDAARSGDAQPRERAAFPAPGPLPGPRGAGSAAGGRARVTACTVGCLVRQVLAQLAVAFGAGIAEEQDGTVAGRERQQRDGDRAVQVLLRAVLAAVSG